MADDSDDDPFARRDEGSSEEESGEEEDGEEEGSEMEGDGIESESESELDSRSESEGEGEDESESESVIDSFSDEEDASDEEDKPNGDASTQREELRKLMAADQKTVAATISQAAKADAAKGKAVKQQRRIFDALLNTRIKLQKGLAAINELPSVLSVDALDTDAVKSAESAALSLWSTLEDLRLALSDARSQETSKKRKRPPQVSSSTSTESLWKRMADLEAESESHRRAVFEKWSSKIRGTGATLADARGKLLGNSNQQSIMAVLETHIAAEQGERGAKRMRRSQEESGNIVYDDTLFYQALLRDLVEQRMSSSDAITNGIDSLQIQLPINPITGMRKDKVKNVVDTRASKGRKMRFNVHEKLQNFMAPEDRTTWSTRARDEFFASLLGRPASKVLGEDDEEESEAESERDIEESGLRLFRN